MSNDTTATMTATISEATAMATPSTAIQKKAATMSEADLSALGKRARMEREAAEEYADLMEEVGLLDKLARSLDMAHQAQQSLIKSLDAADELTKELWKRRMASIRRELEGENATPLERMLIERIALCWLHVHIVEMEVAQRSGTMTLTVGEYQQKRLDKAHKRHLSAIKALAQVRKMALPTPPVLMVGSVTGPVNVGGHQVNVATGGTSRTTAGKATTSTGTKADSLEAGTHDPEASRLERAAAP